MWITMAWAIDGPASEAPASSIAAANALSSFTFIFCSFLAAYSSLLGDRVAMEVPGCNILIRKESEEKPVSNVKSADIKKWPMS
jgi:hypothetical protein